MNFYVLAIAIALLLALSGCEGNWGKAFVQGQWFEKACGAGAATTRQARTAPARTFRRRRQSERQEDGRGERHPS